MRPERFDAVAIGMTIVLIGVFGLCQGLTYPLLSLILERQGVDPALIGTSAATMPLGIMVAAAFLPALSQRLGGAPRVALLSVIGEAVLLALAGMVQNVWAWFPIRFLLGCAVSGIYVTSEVWINDLAPAALRGRLLGLFASALSLGFATGPFILVWTGVEGLAPFVTIVGIMLATALVLRLAFSHMPRVGSHERVSVLGFLPLAPFLLTLVLIVAAYDQAFLSLFPVFATSSGLRETTIPVAITVWAAGNILLQIPIGTLADRWSRRATAILLCAVTVAGALLLPQALAIPWLFWPLLFVWGPAAYGVYLLAMMELGERFRGGTLLAGNAAFAVMWGVGGMAGPPAVGSAMTLFGPQTFPIGLAAIYGALLILVATRPPPRA